MGHVDLYQNDILFERFSLESHPTLILFRGINEIGRFTEGHTAIGVLNWAHEQVEKDLQNKQNVLADLGKRNNQKGHNLILAQSSSLTVDKINSQNLVGIQSGEVVGVDQTNYKEIIFDEDKDVFVKFFRDGCSHCAAIKEDWEQLGNDINSVPAGVVIAEMERTIVPSEIKLVTCP